MCTVAGERARDRSCARLCDLATSLSLLSCDSPERWERPAWSWWHLNVPVSWRAPRAAPVLPSLGWLRVQAKESKQGPSPTRKCPGWGSKPEGPGPASVPKLQQLEGQKCHREATGRVVTWWSFSSEVLHIQPWPCAPRPEHGAGEGAVSNTPSASCWLCPAGVG